MKLKMKNDPNIDYFEGSVDEYRQIKDELFPLWIDLADIPMSLGKDPVNRIEKWLECRKSGVCLYDSNK